MHIALGAHKTMNRPLKQGRQRLLPLEADRWQHNHSDVFTSPLLVFWTCKLIVPTDRGPVCAHETLDSINPRTRRWTRVVHRMRNELIISQINDLGHV